MASEYSKTDTKCRRRFGADLSGGIVGAVLGMRSAFAVRPPVSDQISLGIVGLGSRGFNLIDDFLKQPQCRITAVCDVDEIHYRDRAWKKGSAFGRKPAVAHINRAYGKHSSGYVGRQINVYSDYRELIHRDDIDAVVIATPDHWHALCTLEALSSGKDVYCEKPVTHLFAEGQAIVSKVAECKAVFQTGSQQRSDPLFQKAVELARNGVLGEIKTVEVGLPPGYEKPMGSTKVVEPRSGLNYDFWCGPSEVLLLMQARHHRWWRGHRAYGGGVLMDWIGHHNDIAHWALGRERSGPTSVESVNWTFPQTEIYNSPVEYTIKCGFPDGVESTISTGLKGGLKIIGSDGWVFVNRGRIEASDSRWLTSGFRSGTFQIQSESSHAGNFLHCIRNRTECIAPAEIAHRSITPGHLGYVSHALGQRLQWDPETESVVGNAEANSLLRSLEYRSPWSFPVEKPAS